MFQQKYGNHAYWGNKHLRLLISPEKKCSFFLEEIMMLSTSRDVIWLPALLWKTKTLASLFLQKKILIFFWRNNDALDFFSKKDNEALHFFWGNKATRKLFSSASLVSVFLMREIKHLIISLEKNEVLHYFFRASPGHHYFFRKKCLFVFEDIMMCLIFFWTNEKAIHFFLKK